MIRSLDSLAAWLGDFYLLSTVLLAITLAVGVALRQPAKRLAVIKATLVALGILAALCALPRWSVVHLRTTEQFITASSANPQAAAFAAPSNLNENLRWPTNDNAPFPPAKPASDAVTVSTVWNEIRWQQALAMLYFMGAAGVFVWLIIGQLAAVRLRRHAQPAPAELIAMLEEVATRGRVSPRLGFNEFDKAAEEVGRFDDATPLTASFGETGLRDQVASTEESPRRELESASRRDAATWSSLSETRMDGFGDTSLPGLELLVSARIAAPVALGLFHPVILLPKDFAETESAIPSPQSAIHSILAHELAHIRNHDLAWLAASRVLLVVLWAQPLYWLVRRRIRFDQETLADAAAAELTSHQQYAEQLVAWARSLSTRPLPMRLSPAVGLWEGPSQLRRRIAMLINKELRIVGHCSRSWRVTSFAVTAVIAVSMSSVTLSLAAPETTQQTAAKPNSLSSNSESDAKYVDFPIIVAQHVLIHDGTMIHWTDVDKKIAALPNPAHARIRLYFTQRVVSTWGKSAVMEKARDLEKQYHCKLVLFGGLEERASIRYDAVKNRFDLAPNEAWRIGGMVQDSNNKPVADAEVVLCLPPDKSVTVKKENIYLQDGRLQNPLDYVVTQSNAGGKFAVYPTPGVPFYLIALHRYGFGLVRNDTFSKSGQIIIQPWAKITGRITAVAGLKQYPFVVASVPAKDGWPEVELWEIPDELRTRQITTEGKFRFDFVPPDLRVTLFRGIGGRKWSYKVVTLPPGTSEAIEIQPPTEAEAKEIKESNADDLFLAE